VAAADKLHNARSILSDYRSLGDKVWDRFTGSNKEEVLWYYRAVTEAFLKHGPSRLTEELARTVEEIVRLTGAAR